MPDFKYYLCDLNRLRDEDLRGGLELRAGLTLLKYVFDQHLGKHLKQVFRWIIQLPARRRRDYFQTVLIYLWNIGKRLSAAEVKSTLQEIAEEEQGDTMPKKFESWTEFLDKEFFKHEQQVTQQVVAKTALRQLQKRFGILEAERQSQIRELPIPQLEQLSKVLLDFNQREGLFAWLAAHGSQPPVAN